MIPRIFYIYITISVIHPLGVIYFRIVSGIKIDISQFKLLCILDVKVFLCHISAIFINKRIIY